jgi:ParB family chromosome partitioning protein
MSERKTEKRGLGRGLSALMADVDLGAEADRGAPAASADRMIPVDQIFANPDQPRKDFDKDDLADLAASIAEKGVIQPLILRENPNGQGYEIVAGERRWRAAQMARVHEVPAVLRSLNDTEVLEIAIIENIQRADLNPVEEAMGFRQLQDKFGHTQEQLSKALGKSRSHIANLMRLLSLPSEVLGWLREGKLSAGHARALITSDDATALAREVIKKGLSVRETERLAKAGGAPARKSSGSKSEPYKSPDVRELQDDLSAATGMRVSIDHKDGGTKGTMTIAYKNFAELDELCRKLSATD